LPPKTRRGIEEIVATIFSGSAVPAFLRQLARPLDLTSIVLIVALTAGYNIGLRAGFYGALLILLLSSWFFKFAYVLLDSVANGRKDTPVMSVEMLNPVDEQRPLAQLIICAIFAWGAYKVGGTAGIVLGCVGLLYLPVSVAVLGASSRAVDAVNPLALTRTIIGLGPYYFAIMGVTIVYALLLFALVRADLPLSVQIAASLFLVLSLFSGLGSAIFERRHRLGYDAIDAPERLAEREERERSQERSRALDLAYGAARSGNVADASSSLLQWLRQHDAADMERDARFFFEQARQWQDEKAFVFISRFLVSRLLESGKTGAAVEIADGVLQRSPHLKLGTSSDTLKIAQLARAAGRRALTVRLLADFEKQFPGDARTAEAVALRQSAER
jgi:hypothetical protein